MCVCVYVCVCVEIQKHWRCSKCMVSCLYSIKTGASLSQLKWCCSILLQDLLWMVACQWLGISCLLLKRCKESILDQRVILLFQFKFLLCVVVWITAVFALNCFRLPRESRTDLEWRCQRESLWYCQKAQTKVGWWKTFTQFFALFLIKASFAQKLFRLSARGP